MLGYPIDSVASWHATKSTPFNFCSAVTIKTEYDRPGEAQLVSPFCADADAIVAAIKPRYIRFVNLLVVGDDIIEPNCTVTDHMAAPL